MDARQHFAEMQELNLQIKQRFDAEQIEFAFPTRAVYLKTIPAGTSRKNENAAGGFLPGRRRKKIPPGLLFRRERLRRDAVFPQDLLLEIRVRLAVGDEMPDKIGDGRKILVEVPG